MSLDGMLRSLAGSGSERPHGGPAHQRHGTGPLARPQVHQRHSLPNDLSEIRRAGSDDVDGDEDDNEDDGGVDQLAAGYDDGGDDDSFSMKVLSGALLKDRETQIARTKATLSAVQRQRDAYEAESHSLAKENATLVATVEQAHRQVAALQAQAAG